MSEMHHDSLGDIPAELRPVFDGPRNRYRDVGSPPVGPMLSAFMAMGLTNDKGDLPVTAASNANEPAAQVVGLPKWRTTLRSNKERVMSAIAAFIGTTMGKVVLGTAVAAASVGTGQAVGVLEVPGLPGGATAAVVESEPDDVDGDAVEALDCSDQADAIEDAAEGHGDDAEEAASEEADAFEDACEEAAEAAEDADSGGDEDDSDLEADDDAEADVEDDADEVEVEDEADEPGDVEDDADEVETEDEIDEPAEVDDDAGEVDDDADEIEVEDEVEDDADPVEDDADEVEDEGEVEVDEPADVDDDADGVDTDAAEDGDEAESADIDD